LVISTCLPNGKEESYFVPEAKLDLVLFKIVVPYPSLEEEIRILEHIHALRTRREEELVQPILSAEQIADYQEKIKDIVVEKNLLAYIARIVDNTRSNANLYLGASPRASIAILDASKALAAIQGRDFVSPDDIKRVVPPILGHRIIPTPEREME